MRAPLPESFESLGVRPTVPKFRSCNLGVAKPDSQIPAIAPQPDQAKAALVTIQTRSLESLLFLGMNSRR